MSWLPAPIVSAVCTMNVRCVSNAGSQSPPRSSRGVHPSLSANGSQKRQPSVGCDHPAAAHTPPAQHQPGAGSTEHSPVPLSQRPPPQLASGQSASEPQACTPQVATVTRWIFASE